MITMSEDFPTNYKRYNGGEVLNLAAGDRLQVRMQPNGQAIEVHLDQTVPVGKAWEVGVSINIEERDV